MNGDLAPIVLFTYNRFDPLKQTVEALQRNYLAKDSELYIFSDAANKMEDFSVVCEIREYLKKLDGFKRITIFEAKSNKGLANSIIEGVTRIINQHHKVIVLEDDLVTSVNFLSFMNKGLDHYLYEESVFSIAGYSPPIREPYHDIYFTRRASSWGWGTWIDRWRDIEWEFSSCEHLKGNTVFKKAFNEMGTDMYKMLNDQYKGKINSWAIRWCLHQFQSGMYTVYPTLSKIKNIGTGSNATHTKDGFNRFKTKLDETGVNDFMFTDNIQLDPYYLKQFLKQYSIFTRIKYKVLNKFKF
jgi:Fe-S cluster biosynthesis and repair protein YggX